MLAVQFFLLAPQLCWGEGKEGEGREDTGVATATAVITRWVATTTALGMKIRFAAIKDERERSENRDGVEGGGGRGKYLPVYPA